ncbi:Methyltransferase domain protein [Acididesulfobacillus acetoxydans]|uniref:Arsenite methyltransferase n=1 Tax=Acididesulfobacillus acetoxydans TaxID=1561005 RepID=A0A8S0W856_9FIRM|nr:arsenite methyltransferase [Acididesulfobacillus acetoxydans]CAA7601509.1 Methyltransferase domain protein [Acididesulfobacillus acetoxydans]CEJ06996.1 UbiE/COQ5 methyltransferase [Acididesulfobacillus acetoxydans]
MSNVENDHIRQSVRKNYASIALQGKGSCCSPGANCCGNEDSGLMTQISQQLGYSSSELGEVPEGANMGLGCGNPQAIAHLKLGEAVLDLGSGGGFDCFLAAKQVGAAGRVIGVDMTPEMVSKARKNAAATDYHNVDFRLGEIENLPVADNSVDVIISNCVINLSPDKQRVFDEAYRVLKPGGRLAISDVVASAPLPAEIRKDLELYAGCMAGASLVDDLEGMLQKSGFRNIRIRPKSESREFIREWAPDRQIEDFVVSATIEASKPAG